MLSLYNDCAWPEAVLYPGMSVPRPGTRPSFWQQFAASGFGSRLTVRCCSLLCFFFLVWHFMKLLFAYKAIPRDSLCIWEVQTSLPSLAK